MKTILVVDDDKMNLATARSFLSDEYTVMRMGIWWQAVFSGVFMSSTPPVVQRSAMALPGWKSSRKINDS